MDDLGLESCKIGVFFTLIFYFKELTHLWAKPLLGKGDQAHPLCFWGYDCKSNETIYYRAGYKKGEN